MTGNLNITANFTLAPPGNYTLTLRGPNGSVSASPNQSSYVAGTVVILTATPNSGYSFAGWLSDVYGTTSTLQVTINQNINAYANFIPTSPNTAKLGIGSPSTISVPGTAGSVPVIAGTSLPLIYNTGPGNMYWDPTPNVGWIHPSNGGFVVGPNGNNGLNFSFDANPTTSPRTGQINILAPGAQNSPQTYTVSQAAGTPEYSITVTASNGTVVQNPNQTTYSTGSQVILTATPITGYQFTGWSGDVSSTTNPLTVTMDGNKNITANFTAIPNPDLYPVFTLNQASVNIGGQLSFTGSVGNRGTGTSNACEMYYRISASSLVPSTIDSYGEAPSVNIPAIPAGTQVPENGSVLIPNYLAPGNYYLWVIVDPENASGESATNTDNNDIALPLTVLASSLSPISAVSNMTHGAAGTFGIPINVTAGTTPVAGTPPDECRTSSPGSLNNNTLSLVVTFNKAMTSGTAVMGAGTATVGTPTFSGSTMTIPLTGVANAQELQINLTNLKATDGSTLANAVVTLGLLIGDVNGAGVVNGGDYLATRSKLNSTLTPTNFQYDVGCFGIVNGGDALLVRSLLNTSLP
jgi:uncharacterized repeat protein (TIGR02543 family)